MSTITIGVNSTAGNNRIRFETLSERLQKVNIDILHQTSNVGSLQTTQVAPDSGELGCFLQDELEQSKKLETSRHFRKFCWEMGLLVQSLPELIHHQNKVVDLLIKQISAVPAPDLPTYFRLVSVLARDLKDDLKPHFNVLIQTLLSVVNKVAYSSHVVNGPPSANPELTGLLFECFSHLLRSQWDSLSQEPDSLRQYYGPLLGNQTSFVRDFAAKSFVLIIRKTNSKVFKSHMRKVIYALATNCKSFLEIKAIETNQDEEKKKKEENSRMLLQLQCDPIEVSVDERMNIQNKSITYKDKRVYELFEGVSLMLFYTTKGVKGRLHSKAIERLRILWNLMFPITNTIIQTVVQEISTINTTTTTTSSIDKKKKKESVSNKAINYNKLSTAAQTLLSSTLKDDQIWKIYATGRVFAFVIWKLFRHITPSYMYELWEFILETVNDVIAAIKCMNTIVDIPYREEIQKYIQITLSFLIEILYFAINHSNGRGINHKSIQNHLIHDIITSILSVCEYILPENSNYSNELIRRTRILFCQIWKQNPNNMVIIQKIDRILKISLPALTPEPAITVFAQNLLPILPYAVVQRHLLQPILTVLAQISHNTTTSNTTSSTITCEGSGLSQSAWLATLLEVISRIHDPREDFAVYTAQCSTPSYDGDKHSSVGQDKTSGQDNDEDSWNNSDSDAADLSGSESDHSKNSLDSSDSILTDNEEDKINKQPYAAVSKAVLSALLQNPENIAALAVQCLTIVQETFINTSSNTTTTNVMGTGKTPKKSKKQSSNTVTSVNYSSASLLAVKCLNWFIQCIPQVLLQQPVYKDHLLALAAQVHSIVSSIDRANPGSTSTLLPQPFLAELIFLTGRLVELDTYLSNKPTQLKGFVHDCVVYLQHQPTSISLSWAIHSLLTRLSPQLLLDSKSLYTVEICLTPEERMVFMEVMSASLTSPSYWLRYNWLRILTHLPPAVLADVEADIVGAKSTQNSPAEVNIARLCLEAMCLSPDIRHEREYARRIGVLEVHLRNGRMSPEYMRIVCGFCLGLLHFKFKPIWEPAVLVLVSAGKLTEGEATIWPLLLKAIEATTIPIAMDDHISSTFTNDIFIASNKVVENSENIKLRKPLSEYIEQLHNNNIENGSIQISSDLINTELFYYSSAYNPKQLVEPDARSDFETYSATVWNILKRSPNITLKRSKVVVALFLNFLSNQYYRGFSEDPEVPYLRQIGLFSIIDADNKTDSTIKTPIFPTKILKKRLELFLSIFSVVTSPKQLYCHNILYTYYNEILAKSDITIVKLAFECILTYKPTSILPYRDNIKNLLDDKKIRDELVNFNTSAANNNHNKRKNSVQNTIDISTSNDNNDEESLIKYEHRAEIIPLLIKIVYGRFISKSRNNKAARDQNVSRRIAVLSFISKMEDKEIRHLLQLMLRGIIPSHYITQYINTTSSTATTAISYTSNIEEWYNIIDNIIQNLTTEQLQSVPWERQVGFLHLLQPIIRILGFSVTSYVPIIHKVILIMLNNAQEIRSKISELTTVEVAQQYDEEEEEVGAGEDQMKLHSRRDDTQALRVRSLCLMRIAEMIDQYHAVYNFMTNSDTFFTPLQPLIHALPTAISTCRANCPSILHILHSLSQYPETITVLSERSEIVCAVITCLSSSQAYFEVMRSVIDIMHSLLDYQDGKSIFPHAELIIASFSKRFMGAKYHEKAELKLSEMDVTPSGSIKSELKLLCRIASGVFQHTEIKINTILIGNLTILLLGMLRTYTTSKRIRVEEDWVIDILQIYQNILFRVEDVSNHIAFISRLFGPATHSFSLFNNNNVRKQLISVLGELSKHPSTYGLLVPSYTTMVEITSDDPNLIGSRDFSRFMPILQILSQDIRGKYDRTIIDKWSSLLGPDLVAASALPSSEVVLNKTGPRNATLYSAVLYEIIRCMYDTELIVRTAALAALKRFIYDCAEWSGCIHVTTTTDTTTSSGSDPAWLELLKAILIPSIRRGFKQSTDIIKKGFILLFSYMVRVIGITEIGKLDESFHGDVASLLHEDPEQDFFENIVHIQTHRRVRAMNKLRLYLASTPTTTSNSSDSTTTAVTFTAATYNHVLIPLAYHFLFSEEFQKKDHLTLMQEAAAFIGSISKHLKWNHYLASIKTILKQLEKNKDDKEKILLTALCAILDNFHFNLSGKKAAAVKDLPDRQGLLDQIALPEKVDKSMRTGKASTGKNKGKQSATAEAEEEEGEDGEDPGVEAEEEYEGENKPLSGAVAETEEEEEEMDIDTATAVAAAVAEEEQEDDQAYVGIAQTLVNSILPWVQVFLLKNGKDHKGNATRTVQPHVALALTKLIQRLEEPVVTALYKHNLFVNLVIRVISTLKSYDASARDTARDCLAKMITTLGLGSLKSVFYELQFALKEGSQRHICNYTVRTILRMVLTNYTPPLNAPSVPLHMLDQLDTMSIETIVPEFDTAIPLIMQSVLDDLAGGAQDDRDADEAVRSQVREAKGSKANDTLELTAKCLLFRPTYALLALDDPGSLSSIHALTAPLLNTLQEQNYDKSHTALVGRIAEALQRVALGLSRNPTLEAKEVLLYLHSTLQPFVGAVAKDLARHREAVGRIVTAGFKRKQTTEEIDADADMLDNDALDEDLPSYLREESSDEEERALYSTKKARGGRGDDVTGYRAATWLPSERKSLLEQRAVVEARNREARARIEVQDGASAPRLTGRNKYTKGTTAKTGFNTAGGTGGDRSTLVAIKYCLTLLYACLKQNKLDSRNPDVQAMAIPFLPLLGKCLQLPAASSVVSLAVRCMTTLIGWGIPVEGKFLTALGNRLMKLIFKGGGLVSTETELAQACTKGMSSLFKIYNAKMIDYDASKDAKKRRSSLGGKKIETKEGEDEAIDPLKPVMPIAADNLRSLVQLLTVSVMEITSSFQTAAFQLVREIVATRVLIPEIYDLVTRLAEQIVLSQRKGVRDSATSIVVTFLVSYPLGEKRVASQLKQLINNCDFEFEEGRAAALRALVMLIKAMPVPVLEDYAQMFFLPATLRVVNDKAAACREQAAAVIVSLVRKVGTDTVTQFQEYALKWLSAALPASDSSTSTTGIVHTMKLLETQTMSLVRTGSQISGLIVKGRPDMTKRDNHLAKLVHSVQYYLQALLEHSQGGDLHRGSSATMSGSLENRELAKFDEGQGELGRADSCWGVIYHLVCLCEQLLLNLPAAADHAVTHISTTTSPSAAPLMELMQEALLFPHAWVRAVSIRVLMLYIKRRDVTRARLSTSSDGTEILTAPNGLYHMSRRLCVVLNQTSMGNAMLENVVVCTVFAIRAMLRNPDLNEVSEELLATARRARKGRKNTATSEGGEDGDDNAGSSDDDNSSDDDDEEEEMDDVGGEEEQAQDAMNRAIEEGEDVNANAILDEDSDFEDAAAESEVEEEKVESSKKRKADTKTTSSTTTKRTAATSIGGENTTKGGSINSTAVSSAVGCGGAHWVMQRLRGIGADSRGYRRMHILKVFLALVQLESEEFVVAYVEHIVEVAVRATLAVNTTPPGLPSPVLAAQELAAELLDRLEQIVGSATFIGAYSTVQRRIQSSKAEKKRQLAAEAITAPHKYAARKIAHSQTKKETKKRQTLRHAAIRGLTRKSGKGPSVY